MTHSLKFIEAVKWPLKTENFANPQNNLAWQNKLVEAVAGFSTFILKQAELKQFPEIIALAYWFRPAHLKQLQAEQVASDKVRPLVGKTAGKVFHIAPANVDTVFLYSALLSVLCGNQNIVRISERSGDITRMLVELLKLYCQSPTGKLLANYLAVAEYSAQLENVTAQLSRWCDLRVIWGGDQSIAAISQIEPNTKQIEFPDRYSVALLSLNKDIKQTAQQFLTDVLPFNQQACSSPKAIYWLNVPEEKQQDFWSNIENLLPNSRNQLTMSNKVEQHILLQKLAVEHGIELANHTGKSFAKIKSIGPLGQCKVKKLTSEMLAAHSGNGLVLQTDIDDVAAITSNEKLQSVIIDDQTLSETLYVGKRSVQIGQALAFDTVWDGQNLLECFINTTSINSPNS
ncbi:acyl-CoA reductase [Catenovulum agarivorans]|uniref:acyl-CoA reductase n=1 Tax=Catenovulum agarivorans TaxID=1172192 RepID=UPI0002EB5D0A|nr:acyl-CoA reductase [Catenovulum agarivorans]